MYASLDDSGQLACVHRHDRDLLEVVGCGILLQHHLYKTNGPELPPKVVDEPVYDQARPEHNVELAETNTLVRMLYRQPQPWVLAVMTRGKTAFACVDPIQYMTWGQVNPCRQVPKNPSPLSLSPHHARIFCAWTRPRGVGGDAFFGFVPIRPCLATM